MAIMHIKRCSTSLVTKEVKRKTILQYPNNTWGQTKLSQEMQNGGENGEYKTLMRCRPESEMTMTFWKLFDSVFQS